MLKEWEWFEAGRRFNNQQDPPHYNMTKTNWDFFNGLQWENSGASPDLPQPVFNLTNRVISFFVASLTSNAVKVSFDAIAGKYLSEESDVDIDILNASFEYFAEKTKLQDKVREMYLNSAITGDMCLHVIYDPNKKQYDGKFSEVEGDLITEVIDSNNLYLGNPNTRAIQTQPHVIISGRATVKELQEEYDSMKGNEDYKVTADSHLDDEDDLIELDDVDDLGKATYIICYTKKKVKTEDGKERTTVMVSKLIKDKYIYQDIDTELSLYPVVFNNWENQRNTYHGRAQCTSILPNQIFINRMFAMAMQSLILTAFPKIVYDRDKITSVSNKIGASIGISGMSPGTNIRNIIDYVQPGNMSPQIAQVIELTMDYTKDMLGANSALLGTVNPEQASGTAITIAARQSGVPLENPKNNMYELLEDLGNVYLDMITTYFGERPVVMDNEEEKVVVLFDFNRLKDIYMSAKVDVGATTYFNEIAMIQTLDNLLASDRITFEDYLERVPDDYIMKRSDLLRKEKEKNAPMEQEVDPLAQLSPEMQAEFAQLPPEQQEQYLQEFAQQQ